MSIVNHLLDTRDCAHPGCPNEAEVRSDVCRYHQDVSGQRPSRMQAERDARLARMFGLNGDQVKGADDEADDEPAPARELSLQEAVRILNPDAATAAPAAPDTRAADVDAGADLEHEAEAAAQEPPSATEPSSAEQGAHGEGHERTAADISPTQETPDMTLTQCKRDGCSNPRLDIRGPYGGLCAGHKNEARAAKAAAASKTKTAAAAAKPKPKPEPVSAPPDTRIHRGELNPGEELEIVLEIEKEIASIEAEQTALIDRLTDARTRLHEAAATYLQTLLERHGIAA